MAPLLEHHVKQLLRRQGLAVPAGQVVNGLTDAVRALCTTGLPAVVKALIPVGRKQKSGAVRFVSDACEVAPVVDAILGRRFGGHVADRLLIESRVPVRQELFLSLNFDGLSGGPVLLLGAMGGIEVEAAAGAEPEAFARLAIDVQDGLDHAAVAAAWRRLGLGEEAATAAMATVAAYTTFCQYDARVLEINPLALDTRGQPIALGALMDVDDEALYRQPELAGWVEYGAGRFGRPLTALERQLLDLSRQEGSGSIRFMEFPGGDLGCLLFGGGCSLLSTDLILDAGGKPATYYDGTAPGEKVEQALFTGVLQFPGLRGLIFGSNLLSQRPVVKRLRPLVDVVRHLQVDLTRVPVLARLTGAGEEEARQLAATAPGLVYCGSEVTLEEAIDRFLDRVRAAGGGARRA